MPSSRANRTQDPTVFERIWANPAGHLFKSERHSVMAVADAFPKLPLQVIVAPSWGDAGNVVHFRDLPKTTKRKLHEVADAIEEKIGEHCTDMQRVITHTEGYGVPDHAHILLCAAERKEGELLYIGSLLSLVAVQHTLELITFEPVEAAALEAELDLIR